MTQTKQSPVNPGWFSCTSLQPVNVDTTELQKQIEMSDILMIGDEVKITTSNGQVHEFEITELSKGKVSGKDISISINEVVSMEKHEIDKTKTILWVGATILIAASIHAIDLFSDFKFISL